jgi:hypothetical protein
MPPTFSRANGWARTRFHGRQAWRFIGDWIAMKVQGEWQLWRDSHTGEAYFASYATPQELHADLRRATRTSREPQLMHQERRPRPPRESEAEPGWRHNDPRWG